MHKSGVQNTNKTDLNFSHLRSETIKLILVCSEIHFPKSHEKVEKFHKKILYRKSFFHI